LFETSDLENCNIIDFTKNLNALISVAKDNNIQLLLETNLPGQETVDLISQLEGEVGVVYDIGNATQCGHDIGKDLRVLSSLIQHVYIKDKDNNGENVELGSGNVLSPGGVFNGQGDEFVQKLTNLIPMNRMASKDEYRGAIQFLCSDASAYMNGQNIVMDGGRSVL